MVRICKGRVHVRNTLEQLALVGPRSLGVALLTAGFVGMVFTIQVRSPAHRLWRTLPMQHADRTADADRTRSGSLDVCCCCHITRNVT